MPSAKLAISPLWSNATPTSACTGGAGGGTLAQPASAALSKMAIVRIIAALSSELRFIGNWA
jgi:hypothetical protein